jgi:sphinganine-1-phosphate aldolase
MMAILSYRQYGRAKGISKPNLVICYTGHVASIKSCKYLDIETRFVDYDSEYCMSFSDTKSKIDDNTIGVYTSCPNYPYGTIDPIAEITAYCKKRDIPVHIDMCLGGFLVPFLKNEKG